MLKLLKKKKIKHKLAKHHGIQQRRTYVKEVKNCRLAIRHFRHVKKRAKAKRRMWIIKTSCW